MSHVEDSTPPAWTYKVKQGGLMRCCLQSVHEAMATRAAAGLAGPHEGELLPCFYESNDEPKMVFRSGVWEWVGPRSEQRS